MQLSTEQERAARGTDSVLWSPIEMPVGPQPIPAWAKGVHVDWMEQFSNSPHVTLKVTADVHVWDNKRYRRQGNLYIAEHPDGRATIFSHRGSVHPTMIRMFRREDGSVHAHRRHGQGWEGYPHRCEPGDWVDVERMATSKQDGFGGTHIHIVMEDGSDLVLRGPWHVSPPKGYVDIGYVDPVRYGCGKPGKWTQRPWWMNGGVGGCLRQDVFVAIMARFAPHLRLLQVTYGGCTTIEPAKVDWNAPKYVKYQRDRLERLAAQSGEGQSAA